MQIELKALLTGISEMKSDFSKSLAEMENLYKNHLRSMKTAEEQYLNELLSKKKNNIDEVHRYELQKIKEVARERKISYNEFPQSYSANGSRRYPTATGWSDGTNYSSNQIQGGNAHYDFATGMHNANQGGFGPLITPAGNKYDPGRYSNVANNGIMGGRPSPLQGDLPYDPNMQWGAPMNAGARYDWRSRRAMGINGPDVDVNLPNSWESKISSYMKAGANRLGSFAQQKITSGINMAGLGMLGLMGSGLHSAYNTEMETGANIIAAYNTLGKGSGTQYTLKDLINKTREFSSSTGMGQGQISSLIKSMATSGALNPDDISSIPKLIEMSQVFGTNPNTLGESYSTLRIQNKDMSGADINRIMVAQQMVAAKSKLSPEDIAKQSNRIAQTLMAQNPNLDGSSANLQATEILSMGSKSGIPAARERSAMIQIINNMQKAQKLIPGLKGEGIFDQLESVLKYASDKDGVLSQDKLKKLGFGSSTQMELLNALNIDYRGDSKFFSKHRSFEGISGQGAQYEGKKREMENTDYMKIQKGLSQISNIISEAFAPALLKLVQTLSTPEMKTTIKELAQSLATSVPGIIKQLKGLIDWFNWAAKNMPGLVNGLIINSATGNIAGSAIGAAAGAGVSALANKAIGSSIGGSVSRAAAASLPVLLYAAPYTAAGLATFSATTAGLSYLDKNYSPITDFFRMFETTGATALQGDKYNKWVSDNLKNVEAGPPVADNITTGPRIIKTREEVKQINALDKLHNISTNTISVGSIVVRGERK